METKPEILLDLPHIVKAAYGVLLLVACASRERRVREWAPRS